MTADFYRLLPPVLVVLAGSLLIAQVEEAEPSALLAVEESVADTVRGRDLFWVNSLAPAVRDAPKTGLLYLHWDEWGHSDLAATITNPFVPADLLIGAARLDGGLGQPILSAVIPNSMTMVSPRAVSLDGSAHGSGWGEDLITFAVIPMLDTARASQTYFHWDQGDYRYQDVQVGGTARLDETRSLVLAGRGLSHGGQYGLSGPARDRAEDNVLQDYVIDYRNQATTNTSWGYTLLFQKEKVGLPYVDNNNIGTSDVRRSATWAHGFTLEHRRDRVQGRVDGSTSTSDLATRTYAETTDHLQRRSATSWFAGRLDYQLRGELRLRVEARRKQRSIDDRTYADSIDHAFDFHQVTAQKVGVGLIGGGRRLGWYGGLAVVTGQILPEGWVAFSVMRGTLLLSRHSTSFLDLPHYGRRDTLQSTSWLPGPSLLSRWAAAYRIGGDWGTIGATVAHLTITKPDSRQAVTGGLDFDWFPWRDALRLRGALSALTTADSLLPPRFNAGADLYFTLPLPNRRARPFLYVGVMSVGNDFIRWFDPRFADTAPLFPAREQTKSSIYWITAAFGVKVKGFELQMGLFNLTGRTIQNAPPVVFDVSYLSGAPLKHYSLSWSFSPKQGGKSKTPGER